MRAGIVASRYRRAPLELAALGLLGLLVLIAVIAPVVLGDEATTSRVSESLLGMSRSHWLGTDDLGRDILARVLVATRLSLLLALTATVIGASAGSLVGALALAPRVGGPVTAVVNTAVAFPGLLLALFVVTVVGAGGLGAAAAVGLAMAPGFARLVQALGSGVSGLDYVTAARLLGLPRHRILLRYVLPNIADPLIVNLTVAAGSALVSLAALSFLGLGVRSPQFDWGLLLESGLSRIYTQPGAALGPGVAICLAGVGFTLAGEWVTSPRPVGGPVGRSVSARPRFERSDPPADDGVARVRQLRISVSSSSGGHREVVHGISFTVGRGERVGLVGESGCGKTVTAMALAGLPTRQVTVSATQLTVGGQEVLARQDRAGRRALRGRVGVVFQDAAGAFNPVLQVGRQIAEAVPAGSRPERAKRAVEGLAALKVTAPALRAVQHPHQLSGGMLQRAMTAMAMAAEPQLLIADEPTTGLDVTVQAMALHAFGDLLDRTGAALLFVSHDLAVVSQLCGRVLVMYAGRIVEEVPVGALSDRAAHPYTRALVRMARELDHSADDALTTLPGAPPSAADVPLPGCPFAPRCDAASERCRSQEPVLAPVDDDHRVACWHPVISGEGCS